MSMTFEEFFKKKRIDLVALETGEPSLFSEFKVHYEQMGEKSFDHTKKYWFNKTRRQFPLAPEVKTEKPHIANPLAEQTVTESLIETTTPVAPTARLGFVPKFRAGATPKPAAPTEDKKEKIVDKVIEEAPVPTTPKLGFVPKFRAGNMPKPVLPADDKKKEIVDKPIEESPAPTPPKLGFVPKFRAGNMPKPAVSLEDKTEEIVNKPVDESPAVEKPADDTAPKPAYKPRFNMKSMPPNTKNE